MKRYSQCKRTSSCSWFYTWVVSQRIWLFRCIFASLAAWLQSWWWNRNTWTDRLGFVLRDFTVASDISDLHFEGTGLSEVNIHAIRQEVKESDNIGQRFNSWWRLFCGSRRPDCFSDFRLWLPWDWFVWLCWIWVFRSPCNSTQHQHGHSFKHCFSWIVGRIWSPSLSIYSPNGNLMKSTILAHGIWALFHREMAVSRISRTFKDYIRIVFNNYLYYI